MDDQNYQFLKIKITIASKQNCVNKNGNNTALPNIYPKINLQATHSKKYCFSSFK
jgi:hypothetical protein